MADDLKEMSQLTWTVHNLRVALIGIGRLRHSFFLRSLSVELADRVFLFGWIALIGVGRPRYFFSIASLSSTEARLIRVSLALHGSREAQTHRHRVVMLCD